MTEKEILNILQKEIHSTVFATIDSEGLPQTCVIDIMLADENGLYFLTARGKSFYDRLMDRPFVAISGMKGGDTLSTVAISVRGSVQNIGKERLDEIFAKNPYMAKIYPQHRAAMHWRFFSFIKEKENTLTFPGSRPIVRVFPLAAKLSMKPDTRLMQKNVSDARDVAVSARQGVSAGRFHAALIIPAVCIVVTVIVSVR